MFGFALFLAVVAIIWLSLLKHEGKVGSVGEFLKHIFFNERDGLVLTKWLGDVFPSLRG